MSFGENRTSDQRALEAHRALSDASRVAIIEELRRAGPLDVAQLAERVGLHHNTIRSHLEVLLKAGLIGGETEKRDGPGRPRVVYRPAAGAPPEEESGFRLLAHILASYLSGASPDPEAAAVEAGRAWGGYLVDRPAPFARVSPDSALERTTRLFQRLGFEPELVDGGPERRILLHRCPFRDLAVTHPEITCSVHLGLIRGALAEMGAPVDGTKLDRFVEPSLCVAHFRDRKEAAGSRR
jgi:predicted ArsR family transcriptional regulator